MSLNSTSVIKIVDLLCEGQIEEIVGGGKGIFLNETAIQNNKGGFNFEKKDVKYILRRGTRNQIQFEDHKKANSNIIDCLVVNAIRFFGKRGFSIFIAV